MWLTDKIKEIWRGVSGMFNRTTIKNIVGDDVVLSAAMIEKIEEWNKMLLGEAEWCGDYVKSLRIESGICREFADVVLNEMETAIDDEKLDKIYKKSIRDLNENLQKGLALGSFILKPLGRDSAEYVTANNFIPIRFAADGKLLDCMFIETKRVGENRYYHRFERHTVVNGNLTIGNKAYYSTNRTSVGTEVSLDSVEEWAGYKPEVTYVGMDRQDFGYYRNPIKNDVDGSFCGVSIFESAIEQIKRADIQSARLDWEFESAERAIHVDERALKKSKATGKSFLAKLNQKLYKGFNLEAGKDTELFKEFSPELRETSFLNGLEEYKRQIEFNVGLSYGDLSNPESVEKTAEEIKTSKSRKYNRVTAIQDNLKECLEDFAAGLAFNNGKFKSGYTHSCTFNDSILTDEETERQQDRQDVAMGVMQLWEYRAKWYNEDEDTAKANLPEQSGVME